MLPNRFPRRANALTVAGIVLALAVGPANADDFDSTTNHVGRVGSDLETPVNQKVTPAGTQVELAGIRPQALALSPDGKLLVTSGLTRELLILNPSTGGVLQRVSLPPDKTPPPEPPQEFSQPPKTELSFTGLMFSPDGKRIFMSNVAGDLKVFGVSSSIVAPLYSIAIPLANAPLRKAEIPAGIAVSPDGKRLYVAFNLSNRAAEIDPVSGNVLRTWDVGVAPFDVVLARNKLYVSNWGGRRPGTNDVTGPAGRGTLVRVDSRSIANEGSISIINLDTGSQAELVTGLHTCAMALSPNGRWLVAANAASDTLQVIDTRSDQIVETFSARSNPADLFGAQPNALAFDQSGHTLFVCNGTQNAVAAFRFNPGACKLLGLIPVGWFPGAIACDGRRKSIYVANLKSISDTTERPKLGRGQGFNSKQYYGSLSLVPLPTENELAVDTVQTLANLRYPLLVQAKQPARPGQPARPVPERVGEPSVFRHVIYIIKENRSYDQVLGDLKSGNGNADLCVFGDRVTPNQHKIVRDFVLLDNTYCCGILSADGHQWADSAIATDYLERQFANFPRSYPAGGGGYATKDALAYSPAGFIWNNAIANGRTVCNFGEFTTARKNWKDPKRTKKISFLDAYRDFRNGSNAIAYSCEPDIEALRPYTMTNTIGWDLNVPDIYRAAQFNSSLKAFEQSGNLPSLVILFLPNDHTSAAKYGSPTPAAQVADNDLAAGQVVDAISHSIFWTNTCIFGIEDDPQNGWDHVSGYRTTAYVISPYTKRGAVISTQYNQTSLLRTMELMLGLPPMNQMDATATPMFDCFTGTPDFTPFESVTNNVPLDEMNPPPLFVSNAALRKDVYASARLPLEKPDQCSEDVLNRILWRAQKGPGVPYPTWAVTAGEDND